MSGSSFPRSEHIATLRQKVEERIRQRRHAIEVAERGLNHYRCQYRLGFRRRPEEQWRDLAVHFQVMDRLETTGNDAELNRILDGFLNRNFKSSDE